MIAVHQCSTCGKREEWGDTWSWFGSIADIENSRSVLKFCSAACAKAAKRDMPFVFDGEGKILRHVSYTITCGLCGREDELDGGGTTAATDAGYEKHKQGGWLCAKCSTAVQQWESLCERASAKV